jgi:3-dehydroquinate dehydratase
MIKNLEQLQKIYNTTCNAYEWKINMLEKEINQLKNKIKQTSCTD